MEGVILVHGILRSSRCMRAFEAEFIKQGYKVLNVNYPSTKLDIKSIVEYLKPSIMVFAKNLKKIHFVGHSLGGIIIRALLNVEKPANLGKVVLVGSPIQGSELARKFKKFRIFKWIFGPAGIDLALPSKEMSAMFGKIDYEIGVIAGFNKYNFLANLLLKEKNDGMVTIKSTQDQEISNHIIIETGHLRLAKNKEVIDKTIKFIKEASF